MSPANTSTNIEISAIGLQVGDRIYDPLKSGTHGQRIEVQWLGHHDRRKRTYVAGVEETSHNPVTLAYDDTEVVKAFRAMPEVKLGERMRNRFDSEDRP